MEEIARQVIQGKWGNGQDRKNRLTAAGYDYNTVQGMVNSILSGRPIAPTPTPATTTTGSNLANTYANQAGANLVSKGPVFSQVLPFSKAWEQLLPAAEAEAIQQISPGIERQLRTSLDSYYKGLAGRGGGRFGGSQVGNLQAEAERNKKSQTLDWLQQRRAGFNELFYKPSETAYNKGLELGNVGTVPTIPTWSEFMKTHGSSMSTPTYSSMAWATL